jgi:hypothetical protein
MAIEAIPVRDRHSMLPALPGKVATDSLQIALKRSANHPQRSGAAMIMTTFG